MKGTSANLKENQQYLIIDLLYGLMLPSGNDSAVCLAENFGYILNKYTKNDKSEFQEDHSEQYISNFVHQMN